MNYWLVKSEASVWSWDQQVAKGAKGEAWTGVRNHSAKLNMMAMKKGDRAFFYHSNEGKEIVGIAEISEAGLADPRDPAWAAVKVRPVRALERPVTLAEIKADKTLQDIELVRLSRLSVAEISPAEWKRICSIARA